MAHIPGGVKSKIFRLFCWFCNGLIFNVLRLPRQILAQPSSRFGTTTWIIIFVNSDIPHTFAAKCEDR